jgi:hypothetical protein
VASDSDTAILIARFEVPTRQKGGGASCQPSSGADITFEFIISSVQVASSFACSVESLSLLPDHYLPGHDNLHCKVFVDHQFD